jgi:CubicO group peptidase (beta-lactamase class C family)
MRTVPAQLIVLGASTLTAIAAHAQVAPTAQIDALFARYDRADSPGCALGVIRDGRMVLQRGYGSANLDYQIPNGPEMVYYLGSVSKQFTAAAIALLVEQNRLSLDDDVRKYIPQLPDYGRTITIRHLVHHTSGLRDIYTLMSLAGIRMEDVLTDDDALALITRQKELNFAPGDAYLYSNSGYWLLGQIVERITGESLRVFADRAIFQPLGMTSTHFHDEPHHTIRNRVVSYTGSGDNLRISYIQNFDKIGAGGLYSTLGDLSKWDANFYDRKLGGELFHRLMHTRGVLNDGDTLAYAFGNNIQQHRGLPIVRHAGSLMGFRTDLVRFPRERFSIITLCNQASIDPGGLADQVAELYLGDRLRPRAQPANATATPARAATAQPTPEPPAAGALRAYEGTYYSDELNATYRVSLSRDALTLTRKLGSGALRPNGTDRFSVGSHTLVFQRGQGGAITGFTVEAGRVRNIRFQRVRQ